MLLSLHPVIKQVIIKVITIIYFSYCIKMFLTESSVHQIFCDHDLCPQKLMIYTIFAVIPFLPKIFHFKIKIDSGIFNELF